MLLFVWFVVLVCVFLLNVKLCLFEMVVMKDGDVVFECLFIGWWWVVLMLGGYFSLES